MTTKASAAKATQQRAPKKPSTIVDVADVADTTETEDERIEREASASAARVKAALTAGLGKKFSVEMPEDGLHVRSVDFQDLGVPIHLGFRGVMKKVRPQDGFKMVLVGPALWIEKIEPMGDAGKMRRGVWIVPITSIKHMTMCEEVF